MRFQIQTFHAFHGAGFVITCGSYLCWEDFWDGALAFKVILLLVVVFSCTVWSSLLTGEVEPNSSEGTVVFNDSCCPGVSGGVRFATAMSSGSELSCLEAVWGAPLDLPELCEPLVSSVDPFPQTPYLLRSSSVLKSTSWSISSCLGSPGSGSSLATPDAGSPIWQFCWWGPFVSWWSWCVWEEALCVSVGGFLWETVWLLRVWAECGSDKDEIIRSSTTEGRPENDEDVKMSKKKQQQQKGIQKSSPLVNILLRYQSHLQDANSQDAKLSKYMYIKKGNTSEV